MNYLAINLRDKLGKFTDQWPPKIRSEINNYNLKLAKIQGDLAKIPDEHFRSRAMKITRIRYCSRAFVFLISCCIPILFGSSATSAHPRSVRWVQLSPVNSPSPRSSFAMTYDGDSGKVVVFGGDSGTQYLNDTWTFDGFTWTHVATRTAPPPRANAQMTYDSVSHKVVLFGGFDGVNFLGDTWLWDGTALEWTQAMPVHQPTAVSGPMLFPDPNGRADLFGGFDGQFYHDSMWQWNGSDWTQLFPPTVPYARSVAAVATNRSTGEVVMFGGLADFNPINTWTYDGTTWTLQSPLMQPLWVYAGSAVFDPGMHAVVLFGGGSSGIDQNTTWIWGRDGANWTHLPIGESPPAREAAGMAYDLALRRAILFGGQDNNGYFNDTWELIP